MDKLWNGLKLVEGNKPSSHGSGKIFLTRSLQSVLESQGLYREQLTDTGLKFIRRSLPDQKYYYLVNHGPEDIDEDIELNYNAKSIMLMDPLSGKTGLAKVVNNGDRSTIRVQLKAGESIIVNAMSREASGKTPWQYQDNLLDSREITGPWELTFTAGGPTLPPSETLGTIQVWTGQGSEEKDHFSGQATYSTSFNIDDLESANYLLEFENVNESVKIWINDQYVGQVWSIPYRIEVNNHLQKGENNIKLEVANLMANRIRYMDKQGMEWRNYHEINFVNIDYKAFDASTWRVMPSGIRGAVKLKIYASKQ